MYIYIYIYTRLYIYIYIHICCGSSDQEYPDNSEHTKQHGCQLPLRFLCPANPFGVNP